MSNGGPTEVEKKKESRCTSACVWKGFETGIIQLPAAEAIYCLPPRRGFMFQPMEPNIITAKRPECHRKQRSLHKHTFTREYLSGCTYVGIEHRQGQQWCDTCIQTHSQSIFPVAFPATPCARVVAILNFPCISSSSALSLLSVLPA